MIVVGGQNVGPEHTLFTESPDIDHCISGEGETAFRALISSLIEGDFDPSRIPGMWDAVKKRWNPPDSHRPITVKPAADFLVTEKYRIAAKPAMMISTSRGCPMQCRFCAVPRTFGRTMRNKPVALILEEIREAIDRGISVFDIEDDNFSFNKSYCTELLENILSEFRGKINLYAMNGLSAEHLDERIVDLLKEAGMTLLNLSVATVCEEKLKLLKRNTSIDQFEHIACYAAEKGLKVMGHFIAGLPGESAEDILLTMRFLSELPLVLGISPFYYVPGIRMHVPRIPTGYKEARLSRFWPADDLLDESVLITIFRLSRWINYLKKKMTEKDIPTIRFLDISNVFPDDPYITGLLHDRKIYGLDGSNSMYVQRLSEQVIDLFFSTFGKSVILS
jgi:radical SAM superfamily enzyme YgiQ (UPF0313 family)